MKRTHEIKVRLNDEEFSRLNETVGRTLYSREAFIRDMLAGYHIREKPPVEVMQMIMQIRRVGITLDRLLKRTYETGFVDMPELRRALESNRALEKELAEIYASYEKEK